MPLIKEFPQAYPFEDFPQAYPFEDFLQTYPFEDFSQAPHFQREQQAPHLPSEQQPHHLQSEQQTYHLQSVQQLRPQRAHENHLYLPHMESEQLQQVFPQLQQVHPQLQASHPPSEEQHQHIQPQHVNFGHFGGNGQPGLLRHDQLRGLLNNFLHPQAPSEANPPAGVHTAAVTLTNPNNPPAESNTTAATATNPPAPSAGVNTTAAAFKQTEARRQQKNESQRRLRSAKKACENLVGKDKCPKTGGDCEKQLTTLGYAYHANTNQWHKVPVAALDNTRAL